MTGQPAGEWLDIGAASGRLGLSRDAIRKRIQRGTLISEKRDGRWFIQVDSDQDIAGQRPDVGQDANQDSDQAALVASLNDQIAFLREELEARREEIRRRDVLVAQQQESISELASRVRALHAGPESTESPETDASTRYAPDPHERSQRPWWAFWRG